MKKFSLCRRFPYPLPPTIAAEESFEDFSYKLLQQIVNYFHLHRALASGKLRRRFQFFFTRKNLTKKLVYLERSGSVGLGLSLVYVQVSPT